MQRNPNPRFILVFIETEWKTTMKNSKICFDHIQDKVGKSEEGACWPWQNKKSVTHMYNILEVGNGSMRRGVVHDALRQLSCAAAVVTQPDMLLHGLQVV